MTEQSASAILPFVPPVPHSEESPYNRACYVAGLIRAASHLYSATSYQNVGLSELLTVLEEKADALSVILSHPSFDKHWSETQQFLAADSVLHCIRKSPQAGETV